LSNSYTYGQQDAINQLRDFLWIRDVSILIRHFFLKTMITNVTGMGEVRLGLDLSTICSSEDDDVNNAGGSSTGA
jgi:hypothetical protein